MFLSPDSSTLTQVSSFKLHNTQVSGFSLRFPSSLDGKSVDLNFSIMIHVVPGVAIAVALVPPIAVAGIGMGWADWSMFSSAFLLFITNLVGIVLSAALTFALLGFSPLQLAKKGIMIWMIIVAVVAVPLYSSFEKMKADIGIQKTLSNVEFNVGKHEVKLIHVELLHRAKIDEIRCEVIASGILSKREKELLKEAILKSIGKKAEVIVTFRYKL